MATKKATSQQIAKLRHETVEAARASRGKGETPAGSNRGAWPERVLAFVGADVPNPYCAASVCYWLHQGGAQHGPKTASSGRIRQWGEANGAIKDHAEYGDVGLVKKASEWNGVCHTLLIIGGSPDALTCVEANRTSVIHITHDRKLADLIVVDPYVLETA